MRVFGLIGYPLSHSFSPGYFANKFGAEQINDAQYKAFPIQTIEIFNEFVEGEKDLCGLNVTIPYKETVIPYLDELDEAAKQIGAVNTILFKDGKTIGYNTDIIGFVNSIKPLINTYHKKALILGTGGASKAVLLGLKQLGIETQFVSREVSEKSLSYDQLTPEIIKDYQVIINTTPLGMYPNEQKCPNIPYAFLNSNHLLYDLIYNPSQTLFMKKGLVNGSVVKNGLEMLHLQAEASWDIWNK